MKSLSSESVKRFFLWAAFAEDVDEEHLFLLAARLFSIDVLVRGDLASARLERH